METTKLATIQSELKAPKNQFNSFGKYKYRSCEDILEALKPILLKHECSLTISDEIKTAGDILYVESTATLCHNDKCVSVTAQAGIDPSRKGMDVAQSFGASSSYARKYALSGLFLLDDTKDADATNTHDEKPAEKPAFVNKTDDDKPWLNKGEPLTKAKEFIRGGGTIEDIQKKYKLSKEIRSILEAETKPINPQYHSISGNGLNGDPTNMFNETPF